MGEREDFWQPMWDRELGDQTQITDMLIAERAKLEQEDESEIPYVTSPTVARAIRSFPMHTGLSLDDWGPRTLRQLSPSALDGLTQVINNIIYNVVWPMQVIVVLLAFLDKDDGGEACGALHLHLSGPG